MPSKPSKQSDNPAGIAARCARLAAHVVEELGLALWDVRFLREGTTWYLRVFIDNPGTPVSIDDCVAVSRRLDALLDEADPIPQAYCLEVGSPGANRELLRPAHYALCAGRPVRLRLYRPDAAGERELTGTLRALDGADIVLDTPAGERRVPKKDAASVRLDDDWDDPDDWDGDDTL